MFRSEPQDLIRMPRYVKNLGITDSFEQGAKVYSYNTHVADILHAEGLVVRLGWWSATTSKHINYVAQELGYKVVEAEEVA